MGLSPVKGNQDGQDLEHLPCEDRLRPRMGLVQSGEECFQGGCQEDGARLLTVLHSESMRENRYKFQQGRFRLIKGNVVKMEQVGSLLTRLAMPVQHVVLISPRLAAEAPLRCCALPVYLLSTPRTPMKRQSLKVQINATDDTVCMRYLRPSQNTKLEGFVLGYGSNLFSNQYIPLPSEGKTYITELGRTKTQKPLQLVVGTLTPTSVFLSWGILVNPQHDWTATSNCASDRFYTVRYREKDKDKKWVFQLCPVTEMVVDNLKPNTLYEFGVKDNVEDSVWSKTFNHKTVLSNKKVNGQLQNMYKLVPNSQTQLTLRDNKKLVPVTIIKQGLNETQQKLPPLLTIDDIPQASRKKMAKNETRVWPAESKTPEVQEISPQSLPASHDFPHVTSTPQTFTASEIPDTARDTTELEISMPVITTEPQLLETALAFDEKQHISSRPETSGIQEMPSALPASLDSHHITFPSQTSASAEISEIETEYSKIFGIRIVFHFVGTFSTPTHFALRKSSETHWKDYRKAKYKLPTAPKETQRIPSKPKTSPKPHIPQAKDVPKETQHVPSKPKTSPSSEVPQTKPAPKDTRHGPSKPKTSPSARVPPTRASPKESRRVSSKPRASPSPDVPHTKPAPKEPQHTPFKPKAAPIPDAPHSKPAPKETLLIPSKPKTSVRPEVPQTKPVPNETYQISPKPKTALATEIPRFNTDDVYTPEDIARQIGMEVEKPLEYSDTWEKPISAKPAGPTTPVRTGTSYKTPTAFATPEYYAPHVKYMKKDDDVPCSITSSLEHFPQEEAGSKEEPTHPPQNPPTNLTVVTVEGCPTFVILDWEKPDNDTVTALYAEHDAIWYGIPFGQLGSAVPAVSPPNFLCTPSLLTEYEVVSTENGASDGEKEKSIITTNQTHSTVENLKPDTSYEFHVKPRNPLGEGPSSNVVAFSTESADPRVSEPISMGKDAIWTEIPFNSDTYSECKGKQYVKRTWYKKFVGKFYNIGDQRGHGEDHCQFVDSFLDGRTGQQEDLPVKDGFFRAVRQEPVKFGKIGGETRINYVRWYECGTSIPGKCRI
ncbi:hypothetical protein QYF61_000716 [Mycteria americana]|uniref:Fibronectin type-III domain-containing protein n=1 Tax=Mycteria americana TaxID=33587 RepID=A0AAN7S4X7_MYCAM|nr:hypothetical protein QYF61_000716 [Mycteria americana]